MSERLKPCPFCGRPDPEFGPHAHLTSGYTIACLNPDCGAEVWEIDPLRVRRTWNTRASVLEADGSWLA